MKVIARIICCITALAWGHAAMAADEVTEVKPPSRGGPVKVHPVKKMDRAQVEKRLADRSKRTQKRNDQARKASAERQAKMPATGK